MSTRRDTTSAAMIARLGRKPVVAIAGITGAVGQEFVKLLEARDFPLDDVRLLASARSAGRVLETPWGPREVQELTESSFEGVDVALFSAGGSQSKRFGPAAAAAGAIVVDNSSAFRMDPEVPLVIPEVNPQDAFVAPKGIIANPNCSTIIMNVAVFPLYQRFGVERIVVSTYQAASGAGASAMAELETQAREWAEGKENYTQDIFGKQYVWNCFSHNSAVDPETGYNEEETKMIRETKKIFHDEAVNVTATCVRIPVLRAHCESINVTLRDAATESEVREVLAASPGLALVDDRGANDFPEPVKVSGEWVTHVGRVRMDASQSGNKGVELFVAGDQLLKGAALNAVQIAELLV